MFVCVLVVSLLIYLFSERGRHMEEKKVKIYERRVSYPHRRERIRVVVESGGVQ